MHVSTLGPALKVPPLPLLSEYSVNPLAASPLRTSAAAAAEHRNLSPFVEEGKVYLLFAHRLSSVASFVMHPVLSYLGRKIAVEEERSWSIGLWGDRMREFCCRCPLVQRGTMHLSLWDTRRCFNKWSLKSIVQNCCAWTLWLDFCLPHRLTAPYTLNLAQTPSSVLLTGAEGKCITLYVGQRSLRKSRFLSENLETFPEPLFYFTYHISRRNESAVYGMPPQSMPFKRECTMMEYAV